MRLTRGWHTDLAILRHRGALVTQHPDHLVVTTPSNPLFHWGNAVLVTDPAAVDDAGRWVETFRAVHPEARHVAIGLPVMPTLAAWQEHGLEVDTDQVLYTDTLPELRPLAPGYRALPVRTDEDWEQLVGRNCAENERTGEHEPAGHEQFIRNQVADRRALIAGGLAEWFGAFTPEGELVGDLGIVDCGSGVARYQAVGTDAAHRGRGLAGHLLGLAARWAAARGCTEWVIVTETSNPAGRLYQSVGFRPDVVQVAAYRKPPIPL